MTILDIVLYFVNSIDIIRALNYKHAPYLKNDKNARAKG